MEHPLAETQLTTAASLGGDVATAAQYTVDELACLVGMSARTIRAHQARRLLPPPSRRGRVAVYDHAHAKRLTAISSLQRQGFNLAAIELILGTRSIPAELPAMVRVLERLAVERPLLVCSLGRHNVIARDECGSVQISRPQAVRAALGMQRVGMPAPVAIGLLGDLLDSVCEVVQDVVRGTCTTTFEQCPPSWDDLDGDAAAIIERVVAVVIEAFRVAVENSAEEVLAERR